MASPGPGDRVIIRRDLRVFEILDVECNEVIATRSTLMDALAVAAQCRGSVWQQPIDRYGHYVGEPLLMFQR